MWNRYSLKLGALGEAAEAAFVLRDIEALSRWVAGKFMIINHIFGQFEIFSGWKALRVEILTSWIKLLASRRDYMQGCDNSSSDCLGPS